MRDTATKLKDLDALEKRAEAGGGAARTAKQHAAGKMTARERIIFLLDEGTFAEFDKLALPASDEAGTAFLGDGVITGHGLIDGRRVFVFAQDFTVYGGSLSATHAAKICKNHGLGYESRGSRNWP